MWSKFCHLSPSSSFSASGRLCLVYIFFMRLSVSSSSWCLGRAAVCDCGTPWMFLLPFFDVLFYALCICFSCDFRCFVQRIFFFHTVIIYIIKAVPFALYKKR